LQKLQNQIQDFQRPFNSFIHIANLAMIITILYFLGLDRQQYQANSLTSAVNNQEKWDII